MGQDSKIGWTHHTANLWWGCVEVSELCDNCYAREFSKRYDRAKWGALEPRMIVLSVWNDLRRFQKLAAAAGEVHRVFVGSMMDIFEKPMPLVNPKGEKVDGTTNDLRRRLFDEVVPASPNLLFLLLTKRPVNIPRFIPDSWNTGMAPANVMFGASMGTEYEVRRDMASLRAAPGRTFVSIEPLLEPIHLYNCGALAADWIIVGCESRGASAGRFQDGYAGAVRSMVKDCWNYHVPLFHKQMPVRGRVSHDPSEWPDDLRVRQFPATAATAEATR